MKVAKNVKQEVSRHCGTEEDSGGLPGIETPGYCRESLRDKGRSVLGQLHCRECLQDET